jgi:hypothetical protein
MFHNWSLVNPPLFSVYPFHKQHFWLLPVPLFIIFPSNLLIKLVWY